MIDIVKLSSSWNLCARHQEAATLCQEEEAGSTQQEAKQERARACSYTPTHIALECAHHAAFRGQKSLIENSKLCALTSHELANDFTLVEAFKKSEGC
tara:strand:- start:191 stop:484 length:294 start_codon:yes stop_codon:yes gene_type:complete